MKLCEDKRKLSMVNVVTILQRAGRNRMKLEQVVVKYLAEQCADLRGPGNELRPQAVGSALYGLQRLGDGPEVRELVNNIPDEGIKLCAKACQGTLGREGCGA